MAKSTGKNKPQKDTYGTFEKKKIIQVVVSTEEKALIDIRAKEQGLSTSNYVRKALGL